MREEELLHRCAAGETAAYEELVKPCEATVWRVCYRMMGNAEDSADAMQEAMLKGWQALGGYRGEAKFSTWLYQIAVRCCLDALRRRESRDSESLEQMAEVGYAPSDPEAGPEQALIRREKQELLQAALDSLPQEMRVPLLLSAVEGQRYEDIAEALELPVGTVKSRISRGRLALKKQWEAWNYFDSAASNTAKGGPKA